MGCVICSMPDRALINERLLAFSYQTPDTLGGSEPLTLNKIADEFQVNVVDLQIHAFMHLSRPEPVPTPSASLTDVSSVGSEAISTPVTEQKIVTLVQETKLEEFTHMRDALLDYKATMLRAGRMLRDRLDKDTTTIPKGSVELYLGAGNNMRQIVNDLLDANMRINGEGDDGLKAIANLVGAIKKS